MSGNPKVVTPSPPYIVPNREKSALFCAMDISWPLQNAQPLGAKLNPNCCICPKKGSAIYILLNNFQCRLDAGVLILRAVKCSAVKSAEAALISGRVDTLKGDAPVDAQIWLTVFVWLAAAVGSDRVRSQHRIERRGIVDIGSAKMIAFRLVV